MTWEFLKNYRFEIHLDYGTYNGSMPAALKKAGLVNQAIGVDVNKEVLEKFAKTMPEGVSLQLIYKNQPIDFPDAYFDSITIIGVIEHVYDQHKLLRDLYRILKPGGLIVVCVPGKHFFSFLDTGNWKFYFPRLHRFYYQLRFSKQEYQARYIDCKNGLIGDVEVEKSWHEHFTFEELESLLAENGFSPIFRDAQGFFMRIFALFNWFFPAWTNGFFRALINWDAKLFSQTEIMVVAKR